MLLVLLLVVPHTSGTPLLLLSSHCSLSIPLGFELPVLDAVINTAYRGRKGSTPWLHDAFCTRIGEPDVCCQLERWNARSCRDRLSEAISSGKLKVDPLPPWHNGTGINVNLFAYHGM